MPVRNPTQQAKNGLAGDPVRAASLPRAFGTARLSYVSLEESFEFIASVANLFFKKRSSYFLNRFSKARRASSTRAALAEVSRSTLALKVKKVQPFRRSFLATRSVMG